MANDFKIEAVISATSDQMKAGFDQANRAVNDGVNQMRGGLDKLNTGVASSMSGLKGAFDGVLASLGGLGPKIAAAIAAVVSVRFMKEATESAIAYKESIEKLSRVMGITSESASHLNVALKMIGVSTETYIGANMRLMMHVKSGEEALNQLGLKTRDVNGALLSQTEIFSAAIRTMYEYKAGADRNQFALYAFGRGAANVYELIRLNNRVMTEAAEIAKRFGLELSDQATDKIEQYSQKLNVMKSLFESLKIKIGMELLPQLANLSGWFGMVGPTAINIIIEAIKGVITVLEVLGASVNIIVNGIVGPLLAINDILAGLLRASILYVAGDFMGAWEAIRDGASDASKDLGKFGDLIKQNATDAYKVIKALWSDSPYGKGTEAPTGTDTKTFPEGIGESPVSKWKDKLEEMKTAEILEKGFFGFSIQREVDYWKSKLDITKKGSKDWLDVRKEMFDAQKRLAKEELDITLAKATSEMEAERKGWEVRLNAAEDYLSAITRAYGEGSKEHEDALAKRDKLSEDFRDHDIKNDLDWLSRQADNYKLNLPMLIAIQETKLSILETYNRKDTESYARTLREKLALEKEFADAMDTARAGSISGMTGTEGETEGKEWIAKKLQGEMELARKSAEIARGDAEFKQQMGLITADKLAEINLKIENDLYAAELKKLQQIAQIWEKYPEKWQEIQNQISQITSQHGKETQKIQQKAALDQKRVWNEFLSPVKSAFSSVVQGMILGTMTLRQGIQTILQSILQSFINVFLKIAENWLETQIMILLFGKATQAAKAVTQITSEAAIGAAAAWASVAAIPVVGWAMGPGVAASTYAGIMAFLPMAMAGAAAEGGWDVDRDSLTMIHAREMVLPANLAEGVRGMVRGGGGGGEGGGRVVNNFQSWDAKDLAKFVGRNAKTFSSAMRKHARNFRG
jgi:hypothetical protein